MAMDEPYLRRNEQPWTNGCICIHLLLCTILLLPPLDALSADSWQLLHLCLPSKSAEQLERGLITVTLLPLTCYYSMFFLSLPALIIGLLHTPVGSKEKPLFLRKPRSAFFKCSKLIVELSCIKTFISMHHK
ncbi:hypothetical protein AMECASPLE_011799 [Ameca splendens]|uniref:Uncharacterized protein n=1 Tax=Ameca splendens TaxID=208324 RepID=A0ABV0YC99_9TELE